MSKERPKKKISDYIAYIDGRELKETLGLIDELPNSYINENRNGTTLLHVICKRKPEISKRWTIDIAAKLIEKGADSNIPDRYNKIPLHYAVDIGGNDQCVDKQESIYKDKFVDLIQLLLENGCDPNWKDAEGITPFHSLYIENLIESYIFAPSSLSSDRTALTVNVNNFKTVYEAARHLITHGGDIYDPVPENCTRGWKTFRGTYPYSNKSVYDIVSHVHNKMYSSYYYPPPNVKNMVSLYDEITPKRHELIEGRERIKELRQKKIDNYEQGAHSLQILALETFLKEMKKTPTYQIIIDEDITSDVKKKFKDYLDTMHKKYNKEKVIDYKDENLKNIIEIIPEFIELLEKETENKIGELNKLSHSLRGFTDKPTEFYK